VTGTIKKNIQTTTIYILCVVWVLTVPKYIDIRLKADTLPLHHPSPINFISLHVGLEK
jgi:hypothetical protein